ncbi:hypothetical protein NG798_24730 [Ancylothrix sp. C2]|uniref:hypothetical protein n=1 Tax=Ancylothrix sp. D3o TaxID=2953691 RepID=UPI0021BA8F6F|nr:hypothetical protein [Ancylothrix sp. D3o]MCT7953008.1 hypothetical protein [Ancylothrix sp. D3o]
MSESMDSKAGSPNKENGYVEKGAKEPTRAAQAAISQLAAYASQSGQGNSSGSSSSGDGDDS